MSLAGPCLSVFIFYILQLSVSNAAFSVRCSHFCASVFIHFLILSAATSACVKPSPLGMRWVRVVRLALEGPQV